MATTPSTFVVGAGPVATALAGALRLGGVPVLGLWARKPERARMAGSIAGVAAFSAAPPDLILESDVIVVAVRDGAIAEVARTLVGTGLVARKHVMIHCSGAIAAQEAFAESRSALGGVAAMHPLRAIVDAREAMRTLQGTVFGVEGDEFGRAAALDLVRRMGGRPIELTGDFMAAYHAAAAMASNYTVALLDAAAALLGEAGIARDDALAALVPLVDGTLANVRQQGLPAALTGPIRRGDAATIERHLAALEGLPSDIAALYRQLGLRTVAIAREAGDATAVDLDAIERLLTKESHGAAEAAQLAAGRAARR